MFHHPKRDRKQKKNSQPFVERFCSMGKGEGLDISSSNLHHRQSLDLILVHNLDKKIQ
jgi:hypothetical protein